MKRRAFLGLLPLLPAFGWRGGEARSARSRLELQRSPVAGFQFYEGERLWPELAVGDPLRLVREPDNSHDGRAVALYWKDEQLGYLPRDENCAVAQMLDRGGRLGACITRLQRASSPWQRVQVAVWCEPGSLTGTG